LQSQAVTDPSTQLWRIARQQVLDLYAHHRSGLAFDGALRTVLEVDPSFSSRLYRCNRVVNALHALPFDQQVAFELVHGEMLSVNQLALVLSLQSFQANQCIVAAQRAMKAQLGDASESAGNVYLALGVAALRSSQAPGSWRDSRSTKGEWQLIR
jgi:DNA-directed RNA polymerase specialized sigma24 family protein